MITMEGLTKDVGPWQNRHRVLDRVDCIFHPREHYVILGAQGSGKSTLVRVISGVDKPSRGRIRRNGAVSLPIGGRLHLGGFSVRQTSLFLAELYGADPEAVLAFVAEFSGLRSDINQPIATLTIAERVKLNFAMGYAIPVDFYLFDNAVSWRGDGHFRRMCENAFASRRDEAGTILATRDSRAATNYGDKGVILHEGKLYFYDSLAEAVEVFEQLEFEAKVGSLSYAKALIERGEPTVARAYIREYLSVYSDDVSAYEMLARLALQGGDYKEVSTMCRIALEYAPDSAEFHYLLAIVAERECRWDDAITYANEVFCREPERRNAAMIIARAYEAQGRYGEAATAWREIAAANKNDQISLRRAIQCDLKAGNWHEAVRNLDLALSCTGADVGLLELRLRAAIDSERWDDADQVVVALAKVDRDRAVAIICAIISSQNFRAIASLLDALAAAGIRLSDSPSRNLSVIRSFLEREARLAVKDGRDDEAIAIFRRCSEINGTESYPRPVMAFAQAAALAGRKDVALDFLRQYLASADDGEGWELLADLAYKSGKYSEAREASVAALRGSPGRVETHYRLASIASREKRLTDAILHATDVLLRDPSHRLAAVLLARSSEALGYNEKAAAVWRDLAARDQNDLGLLRLAIRCDMKAANWPEAIASLELARAKSNNDPALLATYATALLQAGQSEAALRAALDLAEHEPNRAVALIWRFKAKLECQDIGRWIDDLYARGLTGQVTAKDYDYLVAFLERSAGQADKHSPETRSHARAAVAVSGAAAADDR